MPVNTYHRANRDHRADAHSHDESAGLEDAAKVERLGL